VAEVGADVSDAGLVVVGVEFSVVLSGSCGTVT